MSVVLGQRAAPGVAVQGVLGVDEVAVVRDEVLRVRTVGLLVAREDENEIPRRDEPRGLQAEKGRREEGDGVLVVKCAAPVEVPVLLDERERVALPVFGLRRDDVHVTEEGDRLLARGTPARVAAVADDERRGLAVPAGRGRPTPGSPRP